MNRGLPIWRDANHLLLVIEGSVRHWPRYHKYKLGAEMRVQAMQVCRLINRAWRERKDLHRNLPALVAAVDDLKLQIQLGKDLGALSGSTA